MKIILLGMKEKWHSAEEKLKEFTTTKFALKEWLKEFLKYKENYKRILGHEEERKIKRF